MSNLFRKLKAYRFLYRAWRYRWKVERDEIAFVLSELSPGDICVDIGGHKGAFTYWMQRQVGPLGRVYTFEPQAELARYLTQMSDTFALDNVTIVQAAVSAEPGSRQLFRDTDHPTPGATLERPEGVDGYTMDVRTESLDQYFAESTDRPIRLIKCDVEGHELDVFRGAESILESDRPTLLFECEQRHQLDRPIDEVFEFLQSRGYAGSYFEQGRLKKLSEFHPESNVHGEPGYVYNFVFRPDEAQGSGTRNEGVVRAA